MKLFAATATAGPSSLSLSSNAGNFDTCVFSRKRSSTLKPPRLLSPTVAAIPKSSSIRCSLKDNGPVPGQSPSSLTAGVGGFIARSAAILAAVLRAGCGFVFWNLVNLHFTIFMSQVLKAAVHSPIKVTPLHFNPVHVAVGRHFNPVYVAVGLGALSILMWIFMFHNQPEASGAQGPDNVPTTGNKHDPTDTGAREREALPPQQKVKASNISFDISIFKWNCSDRKEFNS